MPLKITSADLRGSAKSALSSVPGRDTNRAEDRDFAWDRFRSAAAQAILADPDVLLYLKLRKMKGMVRPIAEIHGLLCTAVMLTELTVRPEDIGVSADPPDTSRIRTLLSAGDRTSLTALQGAVASAFRDEVRREVRRGYARPQNAPQSLYLVLQEITRRARSLYPVGVEVKNLIADLKSVLQETAEAPVRDRALLALEERQGLDRVFAVSSSVGALRAMRASPALDPILAGQHRQGATAISSLLQALRGLLEARKVASSRGEAAREVAFYGEIAAMIAPLTAEASRAFGLLFLDEPDDAMQILEEIRGLEVAASSTTRATANQLLESCAAEGFDSMYRELEMGYPVRLSARGFLSATRVGAISEVTGDLTYRSG
jgi:hypothetical protein